MRVRYVASGRVDLVESPASIPLLEAILEKYAAVLRASTLLNLVLEPAGDPTPPVAARFEPIEGGCNST